MDIVREAPRTSSVRRVAVLLAVGAIVVAAFALTRRSTAAAGPSIDRGSLVTATVQRGEFARRIPAQGTLVPEHVQWLSALSAARVAHINLRPGATVDPDTVVVVLENPDLELAALEAEHQAASAKAALIQLDVNTDAASKQQAAALISFETDLRDAERHKASAQALEPEGLMTGAEARDIESKTAGLAERVKTEEARSHILVSGRARQLAAQREEVARLGEIAEFRRRRLAALEVRAGIRGVVQEIPLENGQWVAIGALLAKIAEPDHLKAEVKVAEGSAHEVARGLPVTFESSSGAFHGHVSRVNPSVVGGSVKLEVALEDTLPPGARTDQTVTGYVEVDKVADALFVERPVGAQEGAVAPVYRLTPDGANAVRVTARLGRGSTRDVEILGGLVAGDTVVTSDTSSWDNAERVRLK